MRERNPPVGGVDDLRHAKMHLASRAALRYAERPTKPSSVIRAENNRFDPDANPSADEGLILAGAHGALQGVASTVSHPADGPVRSYRGELLLDTFAPSRGGSNSRDL
jgi:hypothetical protein